MHYELYVRQADLQSERMMEVMLERRKPFVEIRLSPQEAEALEAAAGRSLPLVMRGDKVIGGFSDLVNDLRRRRSGPVARPVLAC